MCCPQEKAPEAHEISIIVLSSSFPRWEGDYGGVFVADSASALANLGMNICVVCPLDDSESTYSPEGVEVRRFRYFTPSRAQRVAYRGGIRYNLVHDVISVLQLPLFMAFFLVKTLRYSHGRKCLHANWILPAGLVGVVASSITGKPLAITLRGSDVNLAMRLSVLRFISRAIANRAQILISVSRELKSKVLSWGVPPHKVRCFPDGVDPVALPKTREKDKILYVGRLAPEKRIEDLIDAACILTDSRPIHVTIAGGGPFRTKLLDKTRELGMEDRITFIGRISREHVPALISKASVFVLPSSSEGLPDSVLISMASATPIVATHLAGLQEALDDMRTAILVSPFAPEEIAEAIRFLLQRPDFAKRLGLRARTSVLIRFPRERMIRNLASTYMDVILGHSICKS